jgi:hypothetical protein
VRCCVWAQLLSRLLFTFFFLCLLCEVERPSASQSQRSIPARADGRVRADGRSQQEPTVDPIKSRRSIPTCSTTATWWRHHVAPRSATATKFVGLAHGRGRPGRRATVTPGRSQVFWFSFLSRRVTVGQTIFSAESAAASLLRSDRVQSPCTRRRPFLCLRERKIEEIKRPLHHFADTR